MKQASTVRGVGSAVFISVVLDVILAQVLAASGGDTTHTFLMMAKAVGVMVGTIAPIIIGALIRRAQSLGYILAIAFILVLLVATALSAQSGTEVQSAVNIAFISHLYILAAIVSCLVIKIHHPDRQSAK